MKTGIFRKRNTVIGRHQPFAPFAPFARLRDSAAAR
jgi:hypothetical protein